MPDSKPQSHVLLQLTDFHVLAQPGGTMMGMDTERSLQAVLSAALESGPAPDLALLTGDLVQDPVAAAYRRVKACLDTLPFQGFCLPGNHDDPALMAEHLAGGRIRAEAQVLLGGWQIVCLDSTVPRRPEGRLSEDQFELLERALDQYPERFALVALHHHPRPCGSAWMDTMVLGNNERFFDFLARRPWVRGVVFGHIHQAMDMEFRGLRLLGSPSTCFQFKPDQRAFALDPLPPGWRRIELKPDGGIETRVERLADLPAGLAIASEGYGS
jgi:Icc protein